MHPEWFRLYLSARSIPPAHQSQGRLEPCEQQESVAEDAGGCHRAPTRPGLEIRQLLPECQDVTTLV